MNRRILSVFFGLFSYACLGQDSTFNKGIENYYDLSLEELMNVKISVASVKELTPRESPGIVTLVTSDDIKNLGAHYLMDVLKTVPGFDFGMDVEGVIGIGMRGNWAHEGKILLLIDGQVMNENLYSTLQIGNHYPLNNVERIEIIRGPGSAIYGNCAEYAVINIISKTTEDFNGCEASALYGSSANGTGNRNISVAVSEEQKGFSYDFSSSLSESKGNPRIYKDVYGNTYDMADQSKIKNATINLGLKIKDYQIRGILDNYNLQTRDGYQEILSRAYPLSFSSSFFELKREIRFNDRFMITPKFNFKDETPWMFDGTSMDDEFQKFKKISQHYVGNITSLYDITSHINLIAGGEYIKTVAIDKSGAVFQSTLSDKLKYDDAAVFAQALFRNRFGSFTAGARYNYNSLYASSFVPRFGITKAINMFHIKLLFSKSFRAPSTENIDLNPAIRPENSSVIEMEFGYQINTNMMLTLNAFDIGTKEPIVYYYDEIKNEDAYINYNQTGTRGFEVEYKYKSKLGYLNVNYSFYIPKTPILSIYEVNVNHDVLLGFSPHKINFLSGIKISDRLKLNTSVTIIGPRYGIVQCDEITEKITTEKFNPVATINFNINYSDLFTKGLSVTAGCTNLLDSKDYYIQPYNSLHAPLPAMAREVSLKISYSVSFKKK